MTEEKKDDLNEQQTFLSDHEELLNSINTEEEAAKEQPEKVEPVEELPAAEPVKEETPVAEEVPAPISEPESEPEADTPAPAKVSTDKAETPAPNPQLPAQTSGPNKLGGKKKKKQHPKKQHSAQHDELMKKQALEQQEVKEVLVFIKKYTKPAMIAIAVICAVVLVDKFLKTQRYKKAAMADTALMHAQNADDLQAVAEDYSSTPSAPLALMGLAREKFNAGQFAEAEELYTQFSKKHGHHVLATQAELNLISCKESQGHLGEAHLLYGKFAKQHAGSYLVPSALMGKARCLEVLGELDEAQIAYEDIMVNFPDSSWSQVAEVNLKVVLGKKK